MRRRLRSGLAVGILVLGAVVGTAPAQVKAPVRLEYGPPRALLIAFRKYPHFAGEEQKLTSTYPAAIELSKRLAAAGYQVIVLTDEKDPDDKPADGVDIDEIGTANELKIRIDKWKNKHFVDKEKLAVRDRAPFGLLLFTGHGKRRDEKDYFLSPDDRPENGGLDFLDLRDKLGDARLPIFLVYDACRGAARSEKKPVPEIAAQGRLTYDLLAADVRKLRETKAASLVRPQKPRETALTLFACQPGGACDDSEGSLTNFLADGLRRTDEPSASFEAHRFQKDRPTSLSLRTWFWYAMMRCCEYSQVNDNKANVELGWIDQGMIIASRDSKFRFAPPQAEPAGCCAGAERVWGEVRRQGLSGEPAVPTGPRMKYWPHQTVRNMVALTVVLGVIAFLAATKGAPLDVPADPEIEHMPRPEWYFLSLFELRRYFTGHWEIIATAVIPGAVLLFLICMPVIDRAFSPRASRMLRGSLVGIGTGVWLWLTGASLLRDHKDVEFQASEAKLAVLSARARELADVNGVPVEEAATLLKNDSRTQGPRLFARHCAGCHPHLDANGAGIAAGEVSAPNLFGFGTRTWIEGMLDPQRIASDHVFGKTKFAEGDMAGFVKSTFDGASDDEAKKTLTGQMKKIAATLAAEASLPAHKDDDARDKSLIAEGAALLKKDLGCADCHKFHDAGDLGSAPDLTGYGSRAWLIGLISNPQHERFYAGDRNDRMPAFVVDPANANGNLLTPRELDLLVDWIRGE